VWHHRAGWAVRLALPTAKCTEPREIESTDNVKILALDYTITSTASNILKLYVRFTGTQLLIIHKKQFNWTNVRIEIHSEINHDRPPHDTIALGIFTRMLSAINTGEAYSVRVTQFRREDGADLVCDLPWWSTTGVFEGFGQRSPLPVGQGV
jgi:hypothetical protein